MYFGILSQIECSNVFSNPVLTVRTVRGPRGPDGGVRTVGPEGSDFGHEDL